MPRSKTDLLQGTLDMLILKTLKRGPLHGYAIARTIERATEDVLSVEEGSLYPALHRMVQRGWLTASWGVSQNKRRARYYRLTRAGRNHLRTQAANWTRYAAAVARVMGTA